MTTVYSTRDLLAEVGYSAGLSAGKSLQLFEALVGALEECLRGGRGALVPSLGKWVYRSNSEREKGAAVGLAEGDLQQHWFKGRLFVPAPKFLRANGLAAPPASRELVSPALSVNLSRIAARADLDREGARTE